MPAGLKRGRDEQAKAAVKRGRDEQAEAFIKKKNSDDVAMGGTVEEDAKVKEEADLA